MKIGGEEGIGGNRGVDGVAGSAGRFGVESENFEDCTIAKLRVSIDPARIVKDKCANHQQ